MILETKRLLLREMTEEDFDALYAVLADSDITEHYPYTFDEGRVRRWITRNMERYRTDGFGLWAVVLKETGEMIGDCGVTMQNIHGKMLPEIGYHIRKDQQRRGYASEAAAECIRWAFENLDFPAVYSNMKHTNKPSQRTAMKNGMGFVEEYEDPENTLTRVYRITREEWHMKNGKTICGLDCAACHFNGSCGGCAATGGKPFGGECMVAKCCTAHKTGDCGDFSKNVCALKRKLMAEFNALGIPDLPEVTDLYALVGSFVNLEYTLPGGQTAKFWDDRRIYLGNQLPKIGTDRCYGLTADENYLLVCEYGENGADARIVVFKRREHGESGTV